MLSLRQPGGTGWHLAMAMRCSTALVGPPQRDDGHHGVLQRRAAATDVRAASGPAPAIFEMAAPASRHLVQLQGVLRGNGKSCTTPRKSEESTARYSKLPSRTAQKPSRYSQGEVRINQCLISSSFFLFFRAGCTRVVPVGQGEPHGLPNWRRPWCWRVCIPPQAPWPGHESPHNLLSLLVRDGPGHALPAAPRGRHATQGGRGVRTDGGGGPASMQGAGPGEACREQGQVSMPLETLYCTVA